MGRRMGWREVDEDANWSILWTVRLAVCSLPVLLATTYPNPFGWPPPAPAAARGNTAQDSAVTLERVIEMKRFQV